MKWFSRKPKKRVRTRTQNIIAWTPMTLPTWHESDQRVVYMRRLLEQVDFQNALMVMLNSSPDYTGCTDAAQKLGRLEGYRLFYETLLSLAAYQPQDTHIEPTYQDG